MLLFDIIIVRQTVMMLVQRVFVHVVLRRC